MRFSNSALDSVGRRRSNRKPWELYKAEQAGGSQSVLDALFQSLFATMKVIAHELGPFIPDAAGEMSARLQRAARIDPMQALRHD